MHILLLDTETTDKNNDSRLVQLAYKDLTTGKTVNEYCKPPVPISFGSMAVHHITNDMVADKLAFEANGCKKELEDLLKDRVVTAHNAQFDIAILRNEGVAVDTFIDTLRVARHLLESEQYSLQYLRYSLALPVSGDAHDAMGDVIVLEALFTHLMDVVAKQYGIDDEDDIHKKMIELTNTPVLLKAFAFGKYAGRTFEEIAVADKDYLVWLHTSETKKTPLEQNDELVYTLAYHLKK
jgi:exodeoxyribonuclease X